MVCDDRFTDAAARVACRQLGMAGGKAVCCGAFGASASGAMLLDEVACSGGEARLDQCAHNGWGWTDCDPAEAVGVQCNALPTTSPPPPARAQGGAGRDLTQPPDVLCLAVPSNATAGCTAAELDSNSDDLVYFGDVVLGSDTTYRVVYGFADGARSCPSPAQVTSSHSTAEEVGGPGVYLRLAPLATSQASLARSVVVQRRGLLSTADGLGPAWLWSAWVDAYSFAFDGSRLSRSWGDMMLYYNAVDGSLSPPGPNVAGWRWKFGAVGATDGYLPSVLPDLATRDAGSSRGFNATYQLVYQLTLGRFSFPAALRFAVAMLLQRVEGEHMWTVARLEAGAPELVTGQTALVFSDLTSRAGWGCFIPSPPPPRPPLPSPPLTPWEAPPPYDDLEPPSSDSDTSIPPTPPSAGGSPVGAPLSSRLPPSPPSAPPPPPPPIALTCRVTLRGPGGDSTTASQQPPVLSEARLACSDGAGGAAGSAAVTVQVGAALEPLLNATGVQVEAAGKGSSSGSSGGSGGWGIAFVAGPLGLRLTLVDSALSDAPLSRHGPLLECRGCVEVTFVNVTLQRLRPLPADATALVHGAVAANGVARAALSGFRCSDVAGPHGWACLLLDFQAPTDLPPSLTLTGCTFDNNAVAVAVANLTAAAEPLARLLRMTGRRGAGALAILGSGSGWPAGAGPLSLRLSGSSLSGNSGGSGGALFSSLPKVLLEVATSRVANNTASFRGGAMYFAANVTSLLLSGSSVLGDNTALESMGGAVFAAGSVDVLTLDGRSSMSGNTAAGAGGALCAGLAVGAVSVLGGSSADGNAAGDDGGFIMSDAADRRVSGGTTLTVSGGSSVSGNSAYNGGVISAYWLRRLVVANGSRVDGNVAEHSAGVATFAEVPQKEDYTGSRDLEAMVIANSSSMSYNSAEEIGVLNMPYWSVLVAFNVSNSSRFDGNRARAAPAGVWGDMIANVSVVLNSSVSGNEAASSAVGGGVFFSYSSFGTLLIAGGSRVADNYLGSGDGGVINVKYGDISGIVVQGAGSAAVNNTAANGNGGVAAAGGMRGLTVSGGAIISHNSAPNGNGGVLAVSASIRDVVLNNAVLANNTAGSSGGAIYVGQDLGRNMFLLNRTTVDGNVAATGNGGFLSVGRTIQTQVVVDSGSRLTACRAGRSGGAVYVGDSVADLVGIAGGSLVGGNVAEAGDGGAVFAGFAIARLVAMGGGRLEGNTAGGSGGAVHAGRLLATAYVISGGRVAGNRAGGDGGALFADAINSLNVTSGSAVADNIAGGDGGFVRAARIGRLLLTDSQLSGNRAGGNGGVASVLTLLDVVTVAGSTLSDNVAGRGAGGVLSVTVPQPGSDLLRQVAPSGIVRYNIVGGSQVSGNGAYLGGGAFSISAEAASDPAGVDSNRPNIALEFLISDSAFSANYAGGAGGALGVASPAAGALSARVSVRNCTFQRNVAGSGLFRIGSAEDSGYGGAIAVSSSPKYRADAVVDDAQQAVSQQPAGAGAGVSVSADSACSLWLEEVTFDENRCTGSGGGVAAVSCPATVSGCSFTANEARLGGGGLAAMVEQVLDGSLGQAQDQEQAASGSGAAQRRRSRRQRRRLQQATDAAGDDDADAVWLDVRDSTFRSNVALLDCGGGLYAEVAAGAGGRVAGSLFQTNAAADQHGGGLCVAARGDGAVAELVGGTALLDNSARRRGGGVYANLAGGAGHLLRVDGAVLSGNAAAEGGALLVSASAGSQAVLTNVAAEGNRASGDGGALYAQCGVSAAAAATADGGGDAAPACGTNAVLTLRRCNLTANRADGADGGALYVAPHAAVAVEGCAMADNAAGMAGGSVAAVGCQGLSIVGGSIARSSAGEQGGGVFTQSCGRVLLQGMALEGNAAATGGGAFFAGAAADGTLPPLPALAASPSVIVRAVRFANNTAVAAAAAAATAAIASADMVQGRGGGYLRFGGLGGGVFAHGNVSVLLAGSDMRGGNAALVGSALGSSQPCADAAAGAAALQQLAGLGSSDVIAENLTTGLPWDALESTGLLGGCWSLLLAQVGLPPKEALPVWMQDPFATALQATCTQAPAPSEPSAGCDPATTVELPRACQLNKMLAACSSDSTTAGAAPPPPASAPTPGVRLTGAFLDVAPTHMRLEAFSGRMRPGSSVAVSARLYNGLGQPVQRDTLAFAVTLSIEPADPRVAWPGDGSQLRPSPQRPWEDAAVAYLDPGTADGSLLSAVQDGLATWPYLTARGWPGRYVLVLKAVGVEDAGLYQVAPLRMPVELLPCQQGEAVDLTWSQRPNAAPTWLGCSRCGRGRFTLWRDERPPLQQLDMPDYWQFARNWSTRASEGEATCLPCPAHATCPGGAVLVPQPGYWHSAPDSALFHRCPHPEACGDASDAGHGSGDTWASMPGVAPSALAVAVVGAGDAALTLVNTSSNTSALTGEPVPEGTPVAALQLSASGSDERSEWLSLCHQVDYLSEAVATAAGKNVSGGSGVALPPPGSGYSLAEFVAACSALRPPLGDSRPYLQLECGTGYTSHLCGACTPGYYINSEFECQTCPKMRTNIVLAILAFFGGVALVMYTSLTSLTENYEEDTGDEAQATDLLKVAIVHVQYYIIITRLPVAYPDIITRMQAVVSAVTGAESTVAFSYSCLVPQQASDRQAQAQLLGSLVVPIVVCLVSCAIWAARFMFFNQSRMRRAANISTRKDSRLAIVAAAVEAAASAPEHAGEEGRGGAGSSAGASDSAPTSGGLEPTQQGERSSEEQPGAERVSPSVYVATGAEDITVKVPAEDGEEAPSKQPPGEGLRGPPSQLFGSARQKLKSALSGAKGSLRRSAWYTTLLRLDESLRLREQMGIVLMIAVFILYPGWAQAALSVFSCYMIDDGHSGPFPDRQQAAWKYGYWIRDMAQECYRGSHLTTYVPIGVVSVLCVCLLPPLASFLLLWRNRHKLEHSSLRQRYGFLYSRYKPRFFWWESVLMLEELVLVAVEVFGRGLAVVSHQILLMLAVFIVLSLINMACAPFRSRLVGLLEFLSMGVLSLTITLSLYFVVGADTLGATASNTVGLIIMCVNIALLFFFLVLMLQRSWLAFRDQGTAIIRGLSGRLGTWMV
ncbi:hypothetical protein GPECTOR_137g650 [Gonium pectorale]|uniref:SRCR domain-containing protein n=1 Tax=Gonium pectorale TaxID=33097 RepID=A0A150FY46_GONPE|nr:hypothetical protein GPECTOR_137g650 [Gonium pectorale]|eukprot:KXZ42543.1 hypothetical protein GPECTOR_137g650 [Gonium pectorale]